MRGKDIMLYGRLYGRMKKDFLNKFYLEKTCYCIVSGYESIKFKSSNTSLSSK